MRASDCPRNVAAGPGGGLGPAATTLSSLRNFPALLEGYSTEG